MRKVAIFFSLLFSVSIGTTHAQTPKWERLSWAGHDAGESLALTWNTNEEGAASTVEYGNTPQLGNTATGTAFLANGTIGWIHEVELTELDPDTQYYYRVGGAGTWSEMYTFRTAPLPGCGSMRFIVLGDNRSQDSYGPAPHWPDIYSHALTEAPDFVLDTGDLVKDGEEPLQWVHYLEESSPLLTKAPHMPSIGNHDEDTQDGDYATYNQVFQLPRNTVTETEDYYFFTWGDAIFVALSMSTYTGGTTKFQEQADWLDGVLTENPRKWKFVYFHHPIYTSHATIDVLFDEFELNHPPNEVGQNAALVPIFDKHHVDLVLNGHNHFYERFSPMFGGGGSDQGTPVSSAEDGTVYLITGGAGAFTYDEIDLGIIEIDLTEDLLCSGSAQAAGSLVCSGRHHFVVINVDGNTLTGEVIATAAQNFDNDPDNIEVIDTFSIVKPEPVTECPPPEPDPKPDPEPDAGSTDVVEAPDADPTPPDENEADALSSSPEDIEKDAPSEQQEDGYRKPRGEDEQTLPPELDGQEPRPSDRRESTPPASITADDSGCRQGPSFPLWWGWIFFLLLLIAPIKARVNT